jgi:hypothetical protein
VEVSKLILGGTALILGACGRHAGAIREPGRVVKAWRTSR